MCWTLVILCRRQDCLGLLYLKLRSLGCFFLDRIRSILTAFLASTHWPTVMWHPKSHLLFPERSTRHRLEHTQDAWHIWIPALSDSIKAICFVNSYYSVYLQWQNPLVRWNDSGFSDVAIESKCKFWDYYSSRDGTASCSEMKSWQNGRGWKAQCPSMFTAISVEATSCTTSSPNSGFTSSAKSFLWYDASNSSKGLYCYYI